MIAKPRPPLTHMEFPQFPLKHDDFSFDLGRRPKWRQWLAEPLRRAPQRSSASVWAAAAASDANVVKSSVVSTVWICRQFVWRILAQSSALVTFCAITIYAPFSLRRKTGKHPARRPQLHYRYRVINFPVFPPVRSLYGFTLRFSIVS
ncbi:MAG TPA: hypothetical protein VFB13_20680 [Reyranella sp.]|jgi:hypothetical protein|nr:hypothetical protein [Reyranella sp.]